MYKFPLGPVLNHRKFLEESLQKELAELNEMLEGERKKFSDFRRARKNFSKELQNRQRKSRLS